MASVMGEGGAGRTEKNRKTGCVRPPKTFHSVITEIQKDLIYLSKWILKFIYVYFKSSLREK